MRKAWLSQAAALAAVGFLMLARPAEVRADEDIVDEVKLGVLYHDIGIFGDSFEEGVDINVEVLFNSPNWLYDADNPDWLNRLLNPRPHLGASINTDGDTSQIYFGVTWQQNLFVDLARPDDGVFVAFGAGGAVHDGKLDTDDPDRKSLGSRVLFHLSAEIGYRFTQHLSASVYAEHSSNADLAKRNEGYDNLGLRLGIAF
jgi:lipid A 3-O-deacylase